MYCNGKVFYTRRYDVNGQLLNFYTAITDSRYTYLEYHLGASGYRCTNRHFGADPARGHLKQCWCDDNISIQNYYFGCTGYELEVSKSVLAVNTNFRKGQNVTPINTLIQNTITHPNCPLTLAKMSGETGSSLLRAKTCFLYYKPANSVSNRFVAGEPVPANHPVKLIRNTNGGFKIHVDTSARFAMTEKMEVYCSYSQAGIFWRQVSNKFSIRVIECMPLQMVTTNSALNNLALTFNSLVGRKTQVVGFAPQADAPCGMTVQCSVYNMTAGATSCSSTPIPASIMTCSVNANRQIVLSYDGNQEYPASKLFFKLKIADSVDGSEICASNNLVTFKHSFNGCTAVSARPSKKWFYLNSNVVGLNTLGTKNDFINDANNNCPITGVSV